MAVPAPGRASCERLGRWWGRGGGRGPAWAVDGVLVSAGVLSKDRIWGRKGGPGGALPILERGGLPGRDSYLERDVVGRL